ncbi:hypothetical protein AGMMS49975_22060 [Clostridia bacterium]|nr:hypothetical protein AGMMS49975_22060 [Clostridia bacterium]
MEYIFSNDEFIMLTIRHGATRLVGIPDKNNIGAMREARLGEKWKAVSAALGDKVTDSGVLAAVDCYINAYEFIDIQIIGDEEVTETYYLSKKGVCNISQLSGDRLRIRLFRDKTSIINLLIKGSDTLPARDMPEINTNKAALTDKNYRLFNLNIKNTPKAAQILESCGMEKRIALDAAKGFNAKKRFIVLKSFELKENEIKPKISIYYYGGIYIFRIRIFEPDKDFAEKPVCEVQALTKDIFVKGINKLFK